MRHNDNSLCNSFILDMFVSYVLSFFFQDILAAQEWMPELLSIIVHSWTSHILFSSILIHDINFDDPNGSNVRFLR